MCPGVVDLDPDRVRTNFVFFRVRAVKADSPAAALSASRAARALPRTRCSRRTS